MLDDNNFKLSKISLKERYQEHDTVEKDCSCDSEYLLSAMNRVGEVIRQSFHWVPIDELVYLFIDGAGGRGTKDAIIEYTNNLQENLNNQLVFQVPRTPYSNVLDLGVWCGLQTTVEKTHFMRRCEINILVRSVYETCEKGKLNELITKVFNRLKNFLVVIVEGNGGKEMAESKQGKTFRNLDLSIEQLKNIHHEIEDDIDDNIEQFLDEDSMDNYQDNDNNDEYINGRRIIIDEEVYDEIGIGGW